MILQYQGHLYRPAEVERRDLVALANQLNHEAFGGELDLNFPIVYRALKPVYGQVRATWSRGTISAVITELAISSRYHLDQEQLRGVMAHELCHVYMFQRGNWRQDDAIDRSGHGPAFRRQVARLLAQGTPCSLSENVGHVEMDVGKPLGRPVYCIVRDGVKGVVFRTVPTDKELVRYLNDHIAYSAKLDNTGIMASLYRTTNPTVRNCIVATTLTSGAKKLCRFTPEMVKALEPDLLITTSITPAMFHYTGAKIVDVVAQWVSVVS
jgi:hypothetical protein